LIVLNFAHPLTATQLEMIESMSGCAITQVLDVPTHFDPSQSFVEQSRRLVDSVGLSSKDWQSTPFLLNLPTLHVIAALVLAEVHGRCGYFPTVVRLRPQEGRVPIQYEVAELLNLQRVRDTARMVGKGSWQKET
jgi:hypothetical protein